MKIAYSSEMREIERFTIEVTGIPAEVLMENAGREFVSIMMDWLSDYPLDRIVVLSGTGNNGGDGFVASRYLLRQGFDLTICLTGSRSTLKGPAKIHSDIAYRLGIPIIEIQDTQDLENVLQKIRGADLVIDAMFGTGISRPAEGIFRTLIEAVNQSDAIVVSVDVPSGLSSDSNVLIGAAVNADCTITLGLPKPSLLLYPSAQQAGQVVVADIGIPQQISDRISIAGEILSPFHFPTFFAPRIPDSHKGKMGHVLTIAGSPGKTGAAILSATAAARAGAGLVTACTPQPLSNIMGTSLTEVMTLPMPGNSSHFCPEHLDTVLEALTGKSAVIVGPGLGLHNETVDFLRVLLGEINVPVVIDADALNIIAQNAGPWFKDGVQRVLTPHPGEFSRLTGLRIEDIQADQISIVRDYAVSNSSIVVFKTARTIVAYPNGQYYVNITGNPGLASGGSGDVLAGIIAGLIARKIPSDQAASAGVFWHGLSGDATALSLGEEEMLASDLFYFMSKSRQLMLDHPEVFHGTHIPCTELINLLNPKHLLEA